jgi:signal transduction histidine kinase
VASAVTAERLRIARELHDVVAHSMSLIAVQAGVGGHVARTDPDAAARSLEAIADVSRSALEQTRSMLGMLRDDTSTGTQAPTHGLDDVDALVADVARAGLEVELIRTGRLPRVEPAVSLSAYRVVQESLTNILKHSAARRASVRIFVGPTHLEIDVADPGPRRPPSTERSGHGLAGLDERVRAVGGTLSSGAHDSGFRVRASLPVGRS